MITEIMGSNRYLVLTGGQHTEIAGMMERAGSRQDKKSRRRKKEANAKQEFSFSSALQCESIFISYLKSYFKRYLICVADIILQLSGHCKYIQTVNKYLWSERRMDHIFEDRDKAQSG